MLKKLLSYFKPHLKLFLIDMVCAVVAAAIDLMFPAVSRYVMYELLPDHLFDAFFAIMAVIAVCYVIRAFCYYVMSYLGHTFGIRVETDIRADLFRHLQTLDFNFYDKIRTGNLMSRLTSDLFEITELSHHGPEDVLISCLTITGALIMMFSIEWKLALVVTLLLPVFVIVVMKMRRSMSETSKNVKQNVALISADIESSISGIRTSKAFANEKLDLMRFDAANLEYRNAKDSFYKAMGRFNSSMEFFMGLMPAVVITAGGYLIMENELNYIDLITFTLYVTSFINPVRKLANFAEQYVNGMAGMHRFNEIMSIEPLVVEKEGAPDIDITDGIIDMEHVHFSYDTGREILHDINIHIDKGETIAVVGASGGGKTTLCQLIPRFYDVAEGFIKIDGTDIKDVTKHSLRSHIGIVQQDVFIFADSIRENIRYGRPSATDEEVAEAAKKAEIYDDIMNMPDGFDTYVGERGTRLSGGQKQRVSIARIFLKNPAILILDEATSALDTITEEHIQRGFEDLMKDRTSIVIAHRLATVKNADRILVVENGTIAESGTHDELLSAGGEYAELYNTQRLFVEDRTQPE